MEDEQFTPPSDAVEVKSKSKFTPPSDAVEVKKKDNLESSGATPQEVSPTPTETKKSLLVGESPKKPSAWDTLAGKSSDVSLGGFKINKPIVGPKNNKTKVIKLETAPNVDFSKMTVDQLIDFGKGDEVTYQAPVLASAFGGGVLKTKISPQLKPQFDNFLKQNYQSAIQKTKPYVLNKGDLNSIEDDYKKAQSGGSWLDKAGAYAKSLLNNISMEEDEVGDRNKVVKPLDNLRKEVRDEAIHNKETLLPGQIEYRVKQKFIEERTKEIHQTKMNAAKENLTPAEQYSLGLHKAEQASHLSKENKETTKNYYETLSASKSLLDDKKNLVEEYNKMKQDKTPIPQEYIDRYKDNEHNIALNLELAKTYKASINKNQKDIGTFEQEAAAYTSENNELLDITKRIQSWGYGFAGNIHEFASKYIDKPAEVAFNTLGDATGIPLFKGLGMAAKHYSDVDQQYSEENAKKAQEIKEGKEIEVEGVKVGGVTKTLGLNNVNDYVNDLVSIVGDNAGMTAALLAGGTVGLVGTSVETAGGKVREIRKENEEFNKVKADAVKENKKDFEFNGEKYNTKEYTNKDLHSDVASYVVPIAWGGTMVLPMARQLKFLQNEARIAAALEKQVPDLLQKTLQEKSINWTKEYVGHSLGLARDLKIMGLAQAGLDDALGKKVDYFKVATDLKGVRDAFILHGMNAGFAHALGQTAKPYMTNEESKVIDNNARLMADLNNRLKFEKLTVDSKSLIKKQLDRLQAESKVHIDNVIDRMSNMSDADYSKVIDLAKKSSDLRQEAMDIQNSDFPAKEKQFALDKVKSEYLDNEKVLKYTKENYTPRTDGFFGLPDREQGKLMDRASKELISDAKSKGEREFNFSDRDIKLKAQEIFSRDNAPKQEVVPAIEEKNGTFYATNEKGITKGFGTKEEAESHLNAEEVVTPTEEVNKPKGTEDEISQPIELDVNPKKVEEVVTPTEEAKSTEYTKQVVKEDVIEPLKITRENVREISDKDISNLYDEIPLNLMPINENTTPQDAVFEAYYKSKQNNSNPELVSAVESLLTSKPTEEAKPEAETKTTEEAKPTEEVKPSETSLSEQQISNEIYNRAENENIKHRKDPDYETTKLEYDGDNESIKKEVDRYNRLTRKIEEDGSFSNLYAVPFIEKLIRRGIDTNNVRKLANALRKADIFYSYSREMQNGNNFSTLISDSSNFIADSYYHVENKLESTKILTKLAKELGVDVASLETESNRKVEKIKYNPTKAEAKPIEAEVKPEVKIEEPTPTKTRKQPKEKLEETPKAETEKEIVSLPEVINDENFDDIVKKLMDSDKVTKPCD